MIAKFWKTGAALGLAFGAFGCVASGENATAPASDILARFAGQVPYCDERPFGRIGNFPVATCRNGVRDDAMCRDIAGENVRGCPANRAR